jgi:dynein heavy chain
MGIAGGGREDMDPRFISKFCVFNATLPSDNTVKHIYRSILSRHTEGFVPELRAVVPVMIEITLDLLKASLSFLSSLTLFS